MYGVVSHDKLPKNTFRPKCDHFCSFEFIWWGELWWHALYLEMLCEEIDFTVCYFKLDSQFCVCRLFVTFMSCIDDKRQSKNTGFFHPNRKIFFSKEFPATVYMLSCWDMELVGWHTTYPNGMGSFCHVGSVTGPLALIARVECCLHGLIWHGRMSLPMHVVGRCLSWGFDNFLTGCREHGRFQKWVSWCL